MFGYVRAFKPDMRIKEYDAYKGIYCSLCRELGKGYSVAARFTLSYDFVFLAAIRMSVSTDNDMKFNKKRCPFNPCVKCNNLCTTDDSIKYSAAVAMMLFYEKVKDNIADEKFYKKILYALILPFASFANRKAKKKYPEISDKISGYMKKQQKAEQEDKSNLDAFADSTSSALADIMVFGISDEKNRRILSRIGYCIGKWIYLIDAVDDYNDDLKKKRFNPFVKKHGTVPDYKDIEAQLNVCICEACSAFELLDSNNFREILENILYKGLASVQNKILSQSKGEK